MTKTLINRVLIIFVIISLTIFLKNAILHLECCQKAICNTCLGYTIGIIIILIITIFLLLRILYLYFNGDFDDFFEEYTDPKLKKFCDFLNRRNGGCNEK
jgi:hypothetical protein